MLLVAKAVFIILIVSCNIASTDYAGGQATYTAGDTEMHGNVLSVPYYNQGDTSWCLYYCLTMMADYNSQRLEPWMIASHFNSGNSETFTGQYNPFDHALEDYFKDNCSLVIKKKVWGNKLRTVDPEEFNSMVKSNIDRGQPVLLAFQYNTSNYTKTGHAILAVGYDEEFIYISDPSGAITADLFGRDGEYIAVPINWEEFNEKLAGNIMPSNMAFTIEILEEAPASSPAESIYMTDYSNHGFSCLSFVDRTDNKDTGLLRLDGNYREGYYIARSSDLFTERELTVNDTMSVYFTVANPSREEKEYIVISELVEKDTGKSLESFRFPVEIVVPAYSTASKGVNYLNQLGSVTTGTYSIVLTLSDSEMQEIDSTSIDVSIS